MEVSSLVEQVAPISTTRREGSRSSNKLQGAEERASHQPKEFACLPSFKDGVYIGMVTNRLPEGTGLFRSPAGILYVGEFSHGHFCGYGEMKKANRVYKGQFLNGEMSGIGCIKTKKSIAIAHFIKDKKHGVASISNLDRSQNMDGYYKEGETRGFCIVTDPVKQVVLSGMFEKTLLNGVGKEENTEIVFVGNYRNNKKWGVGKVTDLHTQSTYSGSWKDDLKEGFGYLHDPDLNEDYEGLFSKNHKHGIGRLKCHSTKIAYIGTFEKDYYEGQGRLNFPNSFYLGNFRKSQRSGLGYERTNQEEIYFGYWLNDKRDGIGLDKNAEREYLGEWKRDLPHGRGLITMEGCTKAAIFDHGKPSTLLPDSMIYELEQQFSSLNFEKFIHPMSKYIEDLHYQIETYSQELTNQVEHIETRFESLDSKLKQDIQKLQDQNKQVQEGCNRMAQVLDSLFRSKGLDLRSLATIPYPELHTKTKSIEAQYSPKPEVTKLKSQGNLDSAEGSKPGRPTQNLQVNNPILNHSVRFDSVDHADDSARVTPSLTMNGRESPGRFEVYKQLQSAPKKPDQEKPAYREQALKRISMSEVTPYSNVFRKSKSPENKHGSLAHSRLTAVPSRFENKSKSRTRGAISTAKARATDKKNDAGSEDELTFISNKKGVSAKLDQKKHLNHNPSQKKISKYEEEERAKRVEAERKELHARRRAQYNQNNQDREGSYPPENRKLGAGDSQKAEAQRTLTPQSVPETDILGMNQHELEGAGQKAPPDLNSIPKAKIQASMLVSQFSLGSPELPPKATGEAPSGPPVGGFNEPATPDSPGSPEFGSLKFVPIKDIPKLATAPLILNLTSQGQDTADKDKTVTPNPEAAVEDIPNPDASFEELMKHRESRVGRSGALTQHLQEPLAEDPAIPEIDTSKILNTMARAADSKARKQIAKETEEKATLEKAEAQKREDEAKRQKAEANRLKEAKEMLGFRKSVVKMKQNAVERNTLLGFGMTLVNRIMEQFNEDGEEHEQPLNTEEFTEPNPAAGELPFYDSEVDFLSDPSEFQLLIKGYQTYRKLEADERGNTVCLGGFKSLVFVKVNPETQQYKTVKHYPSKFTKSNDRIPGHRADFDQKEPVYPGIQQMGPGDLRT